MTALHCSECSAVVMRTGKSRAYSCAGCGQTLCGSHALFYVDGNNRAINQGPAWCEVCYVGRYGRRAPERVSA